MKENPEFGERYNVSYVYLSSVTFEKGPQQLNLKNGWLDAIHSFCPYLYTIWVIWETVTAAPEN